MTLTRIMGFYFNIVSILFFYTLPTYLSIDYKLTGGFVAPLLYPVVDTSQIISCSKKHIAFI